MLKLDWMSLCRTFLLWLFFFFFLVMVVYCRQIYFFLAIFLTCIYCWGWMAGSNVPFLLEDSVKISNLFWITSTWALECQHMKRKTNWMHEEVLMFSVREKSLPNSFNRRPLWVWFRWKWLLIKCLPAKERNKMLQMKRFVHFQIIV